MSLKIHFKIAGNKQDHTQASQPQSPQSLKKSNWGDWGYTVATVAIVGCLLHPKTSSWIDSWAVSKALRGVVPSSVVPKIAATGFIHPLPGRKVTSVFSPSRPNPANGRVRPHWGVDFAAPLGTPVLASDSGVVVFAGWSKGGYGNVVILDHKNGYTSRYAHLSKILVGQGQSVEKGATIAKVGTTGDSTGCHLHFEIRKNNHPLDPLTFLNPQFIKPTKGIYSKGFSPYHQGIDIAGAAGTPILAAASGTVVKAGWDDWGLGNAVELAHESGFHTLYGHNSRLLVAKGQSVRQGQAIALMGSTGNSTAPHLHFEIHKDGKPINPRSLNEL